MYIVLFSKDNERSNSSKASSKRKSKQHIAKQVSLKQLKELIDTKVNADKIFSFTLSNVSGNSSHELDDFTNFLDNVSAAVATSIREQVNAYQQRCLVFPPTDMGRVCSESLVHASHCRTLFGKFNGYGLEKVLSKIQMLLLNGSKSEHYAIGVTGRVGSGKTMLMARVCTRAKELFGKESVLMVRYIGLTSHSKQAQEVLRDICMQLNSVLQQRFDIKNYHFANLVNYFHGLVNRISKGQRHFIIVLDGVHRFESVQGTDIKDMLDWFGTKLSPKFHLILTYARNDSLDGMLQKLEKKSVLCKNIINMPDWSTETHKTMISQHLSKHKRSITKDQESSVLRVLQGQKSSSNLLEHIGTIVRKWSSFYVSNGSALPSSMAEAVHQTLDCLERKFGKKLVETIALYISLSQFGLTEMELLDLLSCNNDIIHLESELVPKWHRFESSVWIAMRYGLGKISLESNMNRDFY